MSENQALSYPVFPDKKEWPLPVFLIFLTMVPVIAGMVRLGQIHSGIVTPANARFLAAPLPVVLHIISVTLYSWMGAFQFHSGLRKRHLNYHRSAGKILFVLGLTASLTGLWMSHFYPWPEFDGFYLYLIRLLVGSAMTLFLILGVAAVLRRKIFEHGAWMTRAYALGLGAGTQVFTHLPWALFPSIRGELSRTIFMAAGWIINIAVAEWFIRKKQNKGVRLKR